MSQGETECPFCLVVRGDEDFATRVENRVLLRIGDVLLLPALGPLQLGHVLVVTTTHTQGRRNLPASDEAANQEFIATLRAKLASSGLSMLEVEHGQGDEVGPCISHTHTHLFPDPPFAIEAVSNLLPPLSTTQRGAYVWVSDGRKTALLDASATQGQKVRQLLAGLFGVGDWDWALHPKPGLVAESVAYWQEYL